MCIVPLCLRLPGFVIECLASRTLSSSALSVGTVRQASLPTFRFVLPRVSCVALTPSYWQARDHAMHPLHPGRLEAKAPCLPLALKILIHRPFPSGGTQKYHRRNLTLLRMFPRQGPAGSSPTPPPPGTARPSTWVWAPTLRHHLRHRAPRIPLLHRATQPHQEPTERPRLRRHGHGLPRAQLLTTRRDLRSTRPGKGAHRDANNRPPTCMSLSLSLFNPLTTMTTCFYPVAHSSSNTTPSPQLMTRT